MVAGSQWVDKMVIRALLALVIPIALILILPYWLLFNFPVFPLGVIAQALGVLLFIGGLTLAGWCMLLFFNIGHGTIMPWDPTRKLVAVGPYEYARNPMISGVIAMVVGQALFFGSVVIGILALAFLLINHVYFIYSEEPGLEKRFGESYREYKKRVPRWIPRLTKKGRP